MKIKLSYLNLAVQWIATISSGLSILGCSLVLIKMWIERGNGNNLASKLLLTLCCIDTFTSIFWAIGITGFQNDILCTTQAFMIQWGSLASVLWNVVMANLLHTWIVKKKHEDRIRPI
eukprot:gene10581-22079_t